VASGDPTRRWALAFPDGAVRFPGIARTEAEEAIAALGRMEPARWERSLVEVTLPVLLSEGAGPYLLDDGGRLVLVLGPHPHLEGARVAMGQPAPDHRIGLVSPRGEGRIWEWLADAPVPAARRIDALDALDAVADVEGALRWQARARQVAPSHGGRDA
jgi:hypothetical protein